MAAAAQVIQFPKLPGVAARVDRREFDRIATRYGDLTAPTLTSVLNDLDRGRLEAWSDLAEFAVGTDAFLISVYRTRIDRVAQADYIVCPSEHGDQRVAQLAAEFIDEQISRVDNWNQFTRNALHGIFPGFSANEMLWTRDRNARVYYVHRIEYRHGHRFRYGPQYDLRLYDRGRRQGKDRYGEVLDPRQWIVHHHQEQAGYPTVGGVMRSVVWPWLFRRWVDKGWILFLEKYGHPILSAKVPPDTPDAVRDQIKTDLENMSYDHVEVFEQGVEVEVNASGTQGSNDVHDKYMRAKREEISMAVLGVADAVEPGAHGSQAAISTRAGVAMDPRMVSDGDAFADTLRPSFFAQSIAMNDCRRLFGVGVDQVPVPTYRLKTADDEVVRDQSDKAEEVQEEARAEVVERARIDVRGELEEEEPTNSNMASDEVASMRELVLSAAKKELPADTVKLMLSVAFPGQDTSTWDAILAPLEPKRRKRKRDTAQLDLLPKASPPVRGTKTSGARTISRTRSGSPSPLERALKGELAGRES